MFENIRNIQIVNIKNRTYSPGAIKSFTSIRHVFSIVNKGMASHNFDGNVIVTKPNELLFKPMGASYSFKVLSDAPVTTTFISFEAEISDAKPMVFSVETFEKLLYLTTKMPGEWAIGEPHKKYKCISTFYSLLSLLSKQESSERDISSKFHLLKPAESYLREHLFDSTLSVERLCNLCGISDTYFRKIFMQKYGETPRKYILNKRLIQAEAILNDHDSTSIKEIANQVGFDDPLYFSRVFKKKYNVSPTDF